MPQTGLDCLLLVTESERGPAPAAIEVTKPEGSSPQPIPRFNLSRRRHLENRHGVHVIRRF